MIKSFFFNRELVSTVLKVCFCCLAFSNVVLAFSFLRTTSFLMTYKESKCIESRSRNSKNSSK